MFCRPIRRLALATALAACACSAPAESLTLRAAIARTLQHHPSLRSDAAQAEALRQQANVDGLAPPLTFGAELENVVGTGAVSGINGAETTLRLGRVVELGGKRQARRDRTLAEVDRQQNVLVKRQLDLAAETTRRYVAITQGQLALALAERQVKLARETRAAVHSRFDQGVVPEADLVPTEIAVARAELLEEHARHELLSARFALATLWGSTAPEDIESTGALLDLPPVPDFQTLATRLEQTPDVATYALELAKIDADRTLARASGRPDLSFTAGVRRLEALDDQAFVLSFSMPLGTGSRATPAIARADAEAEAVEARREAALQEARKLLFERLQELRHARTEVEALGERMIPAAQRGLALTRTAYENARYSALQLTQAQATLLELEQSQLAAAARYHLLLTDIERATAAAGATP